MKVLQINTVYGQGSTGGIAKDLHDACGEQGIACLAAHRCDQNGQPSLPDSVQISSKWDSRIHGWWSRLTMFKGTGSVLKTCRFLKKVKKFGPDVIHLHNLHGSYINLPLLFRYIKKHRIRVVWTLHDCWAFTAICSHFAMVGCEKWRDGCYHCPQRRRFSSAPLDMTKMVWKAKRGWFTGVPELTVVTPSHWLESLARKSFLGEYSVRTIYNGIDLEVFHPTSSDFRQKHGLENKKIVLGVAFDWGYGKGLDVFIRLAERLGDTYRIVLVGTNPVIDRQLPGNILSIHRTADRKGLAAIYTAADVFFNPTREEVLGLVNLEALACGTPVITFRTGGSPECVNDRCGAVIDCDDVDAAWDQIHRICTEKPYGQEQCRRRAMEFDKHRSIAQYLELYRGNDPIE